MLSIALLVLLQATAGQVVLAWDPNSESDLAGYKVYMGNASGSYGTPVDVPGTPASPTYTATGLAPGNWFFAVTAYNLQGAESGYSNEVSTTILAPPTGLKITSQSVSLRWFGVVLLATTDSKASSVLRYRKLGVTAWSTVITAPTPTKTEHRAVLYFPTGATYYSYEWEATASDGSVVKGSGTFVTR